METKYRELRQRLGEINDLDSAIAVLDWDQSTYMPQGGAEARGRQMGTLAQISQQKLIDPAVGRLLEDLASYEQSLPYDSDEASLIRLARREYERMVKVPSELMGEIFHNRAVSYAAWAKARPANNFAAIQPYLERTLELSRQFANCFPGYDHIIDPLININDFGMKASSIKAIFGSLRQELVPMVQAIAKQPEIDDSCLHSHFPAQDQIAFASEVVRQLGYDFNRGRIDKTHHPFETHFSIGDVRITTRVNENDFGENLFSLIHESGHAMYEQGVSLRFEGTPLASGTSSGVHESQSRLWENVVGRSQSFWKFFYPKLQQAFPAQFGSVSMDNFYRAINKVKRSLIRTEADEVTYNLHVMLRFDFEMALLEGSLAVKDLPDAWRARFEQDFGMVPPDDRNGAMQDVHWFAGMIGGQFQGYTLGNILSAQFFSSALQAHPEIPDQIEFGNFEPLHSWLVENVYQYGSKYSASEVIQKATGGPLRIEPYIQSLKTKYGELYRL